MPWSSSPVWHTCKTSPGGGDVTTDDIDSSGATFGVAACASYSDANTNMSDSRGNIWNELTKYATVNVAGVKIFWSFLSNSVGINTNFTAGNGGTCYPSLYVAGFSGTPYVTPFDTEAGNPVLIDDTEITPNYDNELVISAYASLGGTGSISGFTVIDTLPNVPAAGLAGGLAFLIQSSAAFVLASWDDGVSDTGAGAAAAFRPAADSGGGFKYPGYQSPFGYHRNKPFKNQLFREQMRNAPILRAA